MINLKENLLVNNSFCTLEDSELKQKFNQLKSLGLEENCSEIVQILAEFIKRIYNYNIEHEDIELLLSCTNHICTDTSSEKAFYSFLIYTILCDIQKQQIHCLFVDDFLAKKYFDKALKLYKETGTGVSYNTNININLQIKNKIYSNNIIFSNWKRIGFDKIDVLNISKISDRFDIKFENAFIFDIDRIIYDFEKYSLKIKTKGLNPDSVKIKELFKGYKNITGVSPSLSYEAKKIEKSYNIKTKITNNPKEIENIIKGAKEKFHSSRDEKIRQLARKIESLAKNEETIVIDVDNKEDLELLEEYLKLKKVKYNLVTPKANIQDPNISQIVMPNKISVMSNLLSSAITPKCGGNPEEIAQYSAERANTDRNSNFYKEKLKKELKIQKEISEKNSSLIKEKGGINIIFASHYTELKYEYIILKNYKNILTKDVFFYNCPEDEPYQEYRLNKLNIFSKKDSSEYELLFKVFSKFLFYLRKFSINKFLAQGKGNLIYTVDDNPKTNKQYINQNKIKRNDPCPCGSGKKYKNCCGK